MESTLQKELSKYYERRGIRLVFRNKYTLNELSMEMWDRLGQSGGVDSSSLSRVINGKRLFTTKQLDAFCEVLEIRGRHKAKLIEALEADYLNRYGLSSTSSASIFYNAIYILAKQANLVKFAWDQGLFTLSGFYTILAIWWILLLTSNSTNTQFHIGFGLVFAIIPLGGGLIGLLQYINIRKIAQDSLKTALLFLSLGLISWGVGSIIWGGYNIFSGINIPYPSWADAGYMLSPTLMFIGLLNLKPGNVLIDRVMKSKLLSIFIMISLLLSVFIIYKLIEYQSGYVISQTSYLKAFFDIYYPLWDVILIVTITLIQRSNSPRSTNLQQSAIYYLQFGFLLNFFANSGFSYTTSMDTFYMGNWVDFLFATAMLTLSFGVNRLVTN